MPVPQISLPDLRRVVIAAAVGNVIEWYDFYIFGSLAAILSVQFFSKSDPVAAFLSTVALFSVGFLIRPLGAFVFGWVGDLVGRKYTFLVTLSGMGLSTALIGVIPSYARIGLSAAFILFFLRLIQGLCLGGEYGGAITYVAEHVPDAKRGYYTGWLQTSPTLGIVLSLAVIIGTREIVGPDAWNAWGWRIPFLLSLLIVAIALYIRLPLQETPIFQAIKAQGQTATNPWREAFLSQNLKLRDHRQRRRDGRGMSSGTAASSGPCISCSRSASSTCSPPRSSPGSRCSSPPRRSFCSGWLSDKIGRKPIILSGMLLAALTYYPLYTALGRAADPANIELSRRDSDRRGHGLLRRDDLWPDRRVPRGVLPGPHPVHVGVGARTTSGTAGVEGWCRSSRRPPTCPRTASAGRWSTRSPCRRSCSWSSLFLMPETRANRIWEEGAIEATRR